MADAPDPIPTARHALRLLALEMERTVDGDVRGWLPVTDDLRGPSGGPRLAAVAMLVDALGGTRAVPAADPDWAITSDLSLHLLPTGPVASVEAEVHVRRRGRRTLVLDVDLTADDGIPAGCATVSFTVVARPDHLDGVQVARASERRLMLEPSGDGLDEVLDRPYLEELGLGAIAPGVVEVELRPEISNSLGALHGAVHTAMIEEAAASLGRELLGPGAETTDVHLAFLDLARPGPLRAEAVPFGPPADGDRLAAEVRLVDGNGRLCSYATTAVVAP